MPDQENNLHNRMTRIEESFEDINRDISKMSSNLSGLAVKLDAALTQASVPRITMASAMQILSLLGTWSVILGGLIWTHINATANALDIELQHLDEQIVSMKTDNLTQTQSLQEVMTLRERLNRYESQKQYDRALEQLLTSKPSGGTVLD